MDENMKSMVLNEDGYSLETQLNHKRRYEFACQFLNQYDIVLDVGCGNGYGCNILSKNSEQVFGLDINPDSIKEAKENYPQCTFSKMDITKTKKLGLYDVITCLELIEHLDRKEGCKLIGKLANSCSDVLILSTPVDAKMGKNLYHKSQWTGEQLIGILNIMFSRIILFSQDWVSGVVSYPYSEQHSWNVVVCIK